MVASWSSSLSAMTVLPKLIRGREVAPGGFGPEEEEGVPNDWPVVEVESDHLLVLVEPSSDVLVGIPVMGHPGIGEQVGVPTFP